MFNIQNKYNSFGCYRFLDCEAKTIYIGSAKDIHRRIFYQHFSKKGSNLPQEGYKSTARVEIIKTNDYPSALALEIYLIDKYKPKYNKRDKSNDIFSNTQFDNIEYYKKLEKWKLYYTFREYSLNKIKTTSIQTKLAIMTTYVLFMALIFCIAMDIL